MIDDNLTLHRILLNNFLSIGKIRIRFLKVFLFFKYEYTK